MQEGIAGADDDPPAALAGESLIADDRQDRGLISNCIPKPMHEGPERVDERFIRKLCLMFQLPDTEMMEKFSKKLQIVQEKFLVVRFVRWYHYNDLRR